MGDTPYAHDIYCYMLALRQIATPDNDVRCGGRIGDALSKLFEKSACVFGGDCDAGEHTDRVRGDGGKVRQGTGHRTPPDLMWREPLPPKMLSLQREIARECELLRTDTYDGRVIANFGDAIPHVAPERADPVELGPRSERGWPRHVVHGMSALRANRATPASVATQMY